MFFDDNNQEEQEEEEQGNEQAQDPFKTLKDKLQGSLAAIIDTQPRLSVGEFLLNALTLVSHFKMNMSEFEGVMKLVNTLFPKKVVPDTRYLLDKLFKSVAGTHYHFVCSNCLDYIGEFDNNVTTEVQCKNASCLTVNQISNLNESSFFVIFDLPPQIEILLCKDKIFEELKNPFDLLDNQPGPMKDVYNGTAYQNFITSLLPRTNTRHVTCCFGVDGAALYTSSKCQIWPIFVSILELPPRIRDNNLLLAGLWFSKEHAKLDVFLIPFAKHFQELSQRGFQINVRGENIFFKAHLLCCCADAPARAGVQGIHQHGGGYCCHWCLHPSADRKFVNLDYTPEARSQEEIIADGSAAMLIDSGPDRSVNGVTGLSPMLTVKSFNIVDGMILEYFHATAHGVAKSFLGAWLGDDGTGKDYYIGTPLILEKLDGFMDSIRLPKEARRSTRKITEMSHWKGREFENFILYTSIPLLRSTLRPRYLQHWMLFVQAMHFILQEEVYESYFQKAEKLMQDFAVGMEDLYPDRLLTYNFHIVTKHLIENCRRWGPAWGINGYSYEGGNKILKGHIHANLGVASQVCRALSHSKSIDILKTHCATAFSTRFQSDIEKKHIERIIIISEDNYLGSTKKFKPTREESFLCQQRGLDEQAFVEVSKLIHRNRVFTVSSLSKEFDNSVAFLTSGEFYFVKKIIASEELDVGFVFGKKVVTIPMFTLPNITAEETCVKEVSYIHEESIIISPRDLKMPCAYFCLPHGDFIIKVPNIYNTT